MSAAQKNGCCISAARDLKGSQLLFCVGIGLGLALISKIAIVLGVLSQEPLPEQIFPTLFFWTQYMATRIVLIPIMEELLFRGILFGSFVSSFSYKIAMVLSAAIFCAVTFDDFPGRLCSSSGSCWPGSIGGTDNLAVTMVIHVTINLGTFLSMPLYALLTTHRTIGVIVCLFVVFLGIGITYLCTKKFLQKHDRLAGLTS